MKVTFSFRHMAASHDVMEYAGRKVIGSVNRLIDGVNRASLVFSPSRHLFHVHGMIHGPRGLFVEASEESFSPEAAIDGLVRKIESLLRKRKEARLSSRHDEPLQGGFPPMEGDGPLVCSQ